MVNFYILSISRNTLTNQPEKTLYRFTVDSGQIADCLESALKDITHSMNANGSAILFYDSFVDLMDNLKGYRETYEDDHPNARYWTNIKTNTKILNYSDLVEESELTINQIDHNEIMDSISESNQYINDDLECGLFLCKICEKYYTKTEINGVCICCNCIGHLDISTIEKGLQSEIIADLGIRHFHNDQKPVIADLGSFFRWIEWDKFLSIHRVEDNSPENERRCQENRRADTEAQIMGSFPYDQRNHFDMM